MPRRKRSKTEVWSPIIKRPRQKYRPDYDAFVYECAWTQDNRIQLLIVRDLLERQACHLEAAIARADPHPADVRHHQVAKDAVAIMDCLLSHQPRWVVVALSDCLAGGILLFVDQVVGLLLEAGTAGGEILEHMGYRPYRASTMLARLGKTTEGWEGQGPVTRPRGSEDSETSYRATVYHPATPQPQTTTWRTPTPHDCRTTYRPKSDLGGITIILKKG